MTQKQGKYTVGSDNDTADTIRTQLINDAAQFIASQWKKHLYPTTYERVFDVGGTRVKVLVEDNTEAAALKRLDDLMSDRSQDA